jgi:hypothetical protein
VARLPWRLASLSLQSRYLFARLLLQPPYLLAHLQQRLRLQLLLAH